MFCKWDLKISRSGIVIKQLVAGLLFNPGSVKSNVGENRWVIWVANCIVVFVADTLADKSPQEVSVSPFDHQWAATVTVAWAFVFCLQN